MKKYSFLKLSIVGSIIVLTLAITLGGPLEVKATDYTTGCPYGDTLNTLLFTKLNSADDAIGKLNGTITFTNLDRTNIVSNLQNRLDFVWVKANILCMQIAFDTPGTWLDNTTKVTNLFDRYTSVKTLLGATGGTLETFNNTRWAELNTRLNDMADQFTGLSITSTCPALPGVSSIYSNYDEPGICSYTPYNNDIDACTDGCLLTQDYGVYTAGVYTPGQLDHDTTDATNARANCTSLTWTPIEVIDPPTFEGGANTYTLTPNISGGTLTFGSAITQSKHIQETGSGINLWTQDPSQTECLFSCDSKSTFDGTSCVVNYCNGTSPDTWSIISPANRNGVVAGSRIYDRLTDTVDIWEYTSGAPSACQWTCDTNFTYNSINSTCEPDTQPKSCGTLPSNATSSDTDGNNSYSQTWNGANWIPDISWNYSTTPGECTFTCDSGYHNEGNQCVSNTKTVSCGGSIPTGNVANGATSWTETYVSGSWTGTPAQSTYTYNTTAGTCHYAECVQGKTKVYSTCYDTADVYLNPYVTLTGRGFPLFPDLTSKQKFCQVRSKTYKNYAYEASATTDGGRWKWTGSYWTIDNASSILNKIVCQ